VSHYKTLTKHDERQLIFFKKRKKKTPGNGNRPIRDANDELLAIHFKVTLINMCNKF
jgi:hypothetical protein